MIAKPKAKNRTTNVKDNLGLVYRICKKYSESSRVEDSEVFSDGLLGLWNAQKSYDCKINNNFSIYASRCIVNAVINGMKKRNGHNGHVSLLTEGLVDDYKHTRTKICKLVEKMLASRDVDTKNDIKNKKIVSLYYLDGLSLKEIGLQFKMSRQAVHQRVQRTLLRLHKDYYTDYDSIDWDSPERMNGHYESANRN